MSFNVWQIFCYQFFHGNPPHLHTKTGMHPNLPWFMVQSWNTSAPSLLSCGCLVSTSMKSIGLSTCFPCWPSTPVAISIFEWAVRWPQFHHLKSHMLHAIGDVFELTNMQTQATRHTGSYWPFLMKCYERMSFLLLQTADLFSSNGLFKCIFSLNQQQTSLATRNYYKSYKLL